MIHKIPCISNWGNIPWAEEVFTSILLKRMTGYLLSISELGIIKKRNKIIKGNLEQPEKKTLIHKKIEAKREGKSQV
jgi:hypothetical protein